MIFWIPDEVGDEFLCHLPHHLSRKSLDINQCILTKTPRQTQRILIKVLVAAIDAQWEGMGM